MRLFFFIVLKKNKPVSAPQNVTYQQAPHGVHDQGAVGFPADQGAGVEASRVTTKPIPEADIDTATTDVK